MALIAKKQLATDAQPGVLAIGNSAMVGSVTAADGALATATAIAANNYGAPAGTPAVSSRVAMCVNGVRYNIGNGTKVAVPCYISGDGGATARLFSAIIVGDTIRWNGSVAGFELAATDVLDLVGLTL